jgi:hypothetical protein
MQRAAAQGLQPLKLAILLWLVPVAAILTVFCNIFVPYYLRHPAIFISSALLQSSSLVILAWLVTSHTTSYHHFSHMNVDSEPSLTDTLSHQQQAGGSSSSEAPSTWSLGKKAKIRFD